ncbi:MAG: hypothetical protein PHH09_10945 [Methanoregulaceae archaeon]|nr:hypothetical protein [Methanoregulaceae archaeon]MDD5049433.1 hypothetical protein [Methanoregulaceae archaeon]MDD5684953.1 hypothetical protein [Methanoregulaceae archaeon]
MKNVIFGVFLCLMTISLLFSGCLQPSPLSEAQNNPGTLDLPYYGISFEYPKEWTFIKREKCESVDKIRESEDLKIIQAKYTNNTSGFSFLISGSRVDYDPHSFRENFSGSQECGFGWTDDRPNLTVSEAYNPVTIDSGKARRFIFVLHNPDTEIVETYYDLCRTYTSGKSMYYRIFWSVPSDKYYEYKPIVQKIIDTLRIYEPS